MGDITDDIINDLGCVWSTRAYDDMPVGHRPQLPQNSVAITIKARTHDKAGTYDEQIERLANYDL